MKELEEKLAYHFRSRELLLTALTHSSYTNEHGGEHTECYERLEFLGDSILGAETAKLLYSWSPALPEGKMTRIRAELVCEESLHQIALELELGRWMRLGRGEELTGGRERPSILADMVEALIAALYLDGGQKPASDLIRSRVLRNASEVINRRGRDHKTELQELVQREAGNSIRYQMLREEGPDHDKRFTCGLYINDCLAGEGIGRSKKEAEQAAAGAALDKLQR